MSTVEIIRSGPVAVLRFGEPPVNSLGLATRQGLAAAISAAIADPGVAAIVLAGRHGAFSTPIRRGRRCVPPAPGSRPSLTSGRPTFADATATR